MKRNPKGVNRGLDCDIYVAEMRKPDLSVFDRSKMPDISFKYMQRGSFQQSTLILICF